MINKNIGNRTEKLCQEHLSEKGYLCILIPDSASGQPFDAVALKGNKALAFDVKHCEKDYFLTSRIEPNQQTSFKLALERKVKCGFALYSESKQEFYRLPFSKVLKETSKKRFYLNTLQRLDEVL